MKLGPVLLLAFSLFTLAAPRRASADPRASRAAIADSVTKLSASAAALARTAKASDDRGARKKFGPAAAELSDDLAALAKRLGKDVAPKALATDAAALVKDAAALVELADEADDKDERKALRAQASLIAQGITAANAAIDALKDGDAGGAAAGPQRFSGRILNTSDACSWAENLKFTISRDGRQVAASLNMVFPGKEFPLVLEAGQYVVVFADTSGKPLGQKPLDVTREGWVFKSGCVNQD